MLASLKKAAAVSIAALTLSAVAFAAPASAAGPTWHGGHGWHGGWHGGGWHGGGWGGGWGWGAPFAIGALAGAALAAPYAYGGYCDPYYGCGYAPGYGYRAYGYAPNYGYAPSHDYGYQGGNKGGEIFPHSGT
jgi:hypothetical protein